MNETPQAGHQQFAEDLALFALGALPAADSEELETHLAGCAACRRELQQLRDDSALLALGASGATPPGRARERLLAALDQPRLHHVLRAVVMRRPWWALAPVFACLLLAIVSAVLLLENSRLSQKISRLENEMRNGEDTMAHAREVLQFFSARDARHITLVAAQTKPQPSGKAIYLPRSGRLLFMASNLAPPAAGHAYELWLIPKNGTPIPAGVFKPDASGSAAIVDPPLPKGVEAEKFAITQEPEAGSSTPTMPILFAGAGQ